MNDTLRSFLILSAAAGAGIGVAHVLTGGVPVSRPRRRPTAAEQMPHVATVAAEPEDTARHLLLGALGGGLVFYGIRRREALGASAVTMGVRLLSRSHPVFERMLNGPALLPVIPHLG